MHEHSQPLPWVRITHADATAILDFLVYDSDQRKVRHKADFDAQTKGFQCKLAELQVKRYCAP